MKYKLLKPLPGIKAGVIFEGNDGGKILDNDYLCIGDKYYVYGGFATDYPDFFEPINERELIYPENLMEGYVIDGHGRVVEALKIGHSREEVIENQYICGTRFPTVEKAKAFIDLKKDVARFGKIDSKLPVLGFGFHLLGDGQFYFCRQEHVFSIFNIITYTGQDFFLPVNATDEEKENRVKLLKAFYGF